MSFAVTSLRSIAPSVAPAAHANCFSNCVMRQWDSTPFRKVTGALCMFGFKPRGVELFRQLCLGCDLVPFPCQRVLIRQSIGESERPLFSYSRHARYLNERLFKAIANQDRTSRFLPSLDVVITKA